MRLGILSDVHANLDALQAVLEDGREKVDAWWFLVDAVGRGPDPIAVVTLLKSVVRPFSLHWQMGNHDLYVSGALDNALVKARERKIHLHHRQLLQGYRPSGAKTPYLWAWCRRNWTLKRAQARLVAGPEVDFWLVHGALGTLEENAGNVSGGYLFPWDFARFTPKVQRQMERLRQKKRGDRPIALIHGHTHLPYMAMTPPGFDAPLLWPIRYNHPESLAFSQITFINPGSVGQPRNGDPEPHAAYGILDVDAGSFEFRRVVYDCSAVCARMRQFDYDSELIYLLAGRYEANPLNGRSREWRDWQNYYRLEPWGWAPRSEWS